MSYVTYTKYLFGYILLSPPVRAVVGNMETSWTSAVTYSIFGNGTLSQFQGSRVCVE